jgi:hypothetical protein
VRAPPIFVTALVALTLGGCDGDEDGDGGTDGAKITDKTTTHQTPPTAAEAFFESVASGSTQPSPSGSLLDDRELAALVRTAQANRSIARELDGLGRFYDVTPADVAQIENIACSYGVRLAIHRVMAEIPGADLRALPAVNRLVTEIGFQCWAEKPAFIDSASSAMLRFLLANTRVLPARPLPEPTPLMRNVYRAACGGFKLGLVQGIKRLFGHRGPAYGLSLAVGSALTTCPEYLAAHSVGGELQTLIGP